MRYYETIYIVDPNLENSLLEKTMNQIGQELEKTKAKIINHREWGNLIWHLTLYFLQLHH